MTEPAPPSPNAAQIENWNAGSGLTWVQSYEDLDRQIEPLGLRAIAALAPAAGEHVLDVGCGCGQTSVQLAARVGALGRVLGVDISTPMLDIARRRRLADGAPVDFRLADAQCDSLGQARFDAAFSRFGVMFFSDPVAAFTNIRRSLKRGARLSFVCWRVLTDNPWMKAPLDAALPLLPPLAAADPAAPGPFAFAQEGRIHSILGAAGFDRVACERHDALIGGSDIEKTVQLTLKIGPLGAALREHPQCALTVAEALRGVIAAYAGPSGVMMPASVWIVTAKVPQQCGDP